MRLLLPLIVLNMITGTPFNNCLALAASVEALERTASCSASGQACGCAGGSGADPNSNASEACRLTSMVQALQAKLKNANKRWEIEAAQLKVANARLEKHVEEAEAECKSG